MATLTLTEVRHTRPRARTLSLIVGRSLLTSLLPAELFLLILEYAILHSKPKTLALVCRAFRRGLDVIIYRTVVLDAPNTLHLFHQTTQSKKPSFLADHVKKIVVTDHRVTLDNLFNDILAACSGMRSLVIHSYNRPRKYLADMPTDNSDLLARQHTPVGLHALTQLRFCEPGEVWCSPTVMLEALGTLPNLSHLQLARRINANQANDAIFVRSISGLLASRPTLKMVVVSIFPEIFVGADDHGSVEESTIWSQMCELGRTDQRLVVISARYEEWKEGWNDQQAIRSGWHPQDFWLHAIRSSTYQSS